MDASVGFLLENLKDLVKHQAHLIKSAKSELNGLNEDLGKFKAILEEASRKSTKAEIFRDWERRIRDAVYDIEDVIDTCVTEANAGKKKNWMKRTFGTTKGTIALAEQVTAMRQTVKPLMEEIRDGIASLAITTDTTVADARKSRLKLKKYSHIVGFQEETAAFVNLLMNESDQSEILSVIGMAGLGKTTFAWKVFEHETIKYEFPLRIWVNVSENPNMRKIFLDILSQLTSTKPEVSITDEKLITLIKGHLEEAGKYLIVMDDIWSSDKWKTLSELLPENNKWGRVIVTTRNTDVGRTAASRKGGAHNLRFLTADESWELLQFEVYGKLNDVPEELLVVGRSIAIDCKGLPLSIVVIGGILQQKTSRSCDNNIAIKKEWEQVSSSVKHYLVVDEKKVLGSIIALSYDSLPYKLRNCFLYLGVFPEDADIPVKKLIQLWIAEGLLQDTSKNQRLEEVALENLKDLINRNLVMVRKAKFDGEPKICQIHDSIREICKREGEELNLFKEISELEAHSATERIRRICIHSGAPNFFSRKPKLAKARSFLCFNESPIILESTDGNHITDAFGLLRVYDAKDMKFQIFPAKLCQQLCHLRYLTLVVDTELESLPESITNLWNLQSLIVDTPSTTMKVKGDILKMRYLRHLKTKAAIILTKRKEDNIVDGGQELQTLTRVSPGSCTFEVCKTATNLLTLGIQGDLRNLGDFKGLDELGSLNKLKMIHEVSRGTAEYPCKQLPASSSFPPKLKTLVLSGTRLAWDKMCALSSISTLEVLKLKESAFKGDTWKATGTGFINLIYLEIDRSDLKLWITSNDHFPELRFLQIKNSEYLSTIPVTLGKKLEVLSLERVSKDAVICAKKIVADENSKKGKKIYCRLDIAASDSSNNVN